MFFLLLAGCGPGAWQGVDVAGTVQTGGSLLTKGSISFLPAPGRSGPAATAVIENGRFHIASADGPLPGPHKVLVYREVDPKHAHLSGPTAPGAATSPGATQQIRWETKVEIPAGEHFTCDLKLD